MSEDILERTKAIVAEYTAHNRSVGLLPDLIAEVERLRAEREVWITHYQKNSQQAARIKELEGWLVEERARRICHQPREDLVGHWSRYEDVVVQEARNQLRAEGKIRGGDEK